MIMMSFTFRNLPPVAGAALLLLLAAELLTVSEARVPAVTVGAEQLDGVDSRAGGSYDDKDAISIQLLIPPRPSMFELTQQQLRRQGWRQEEHPVPLLRDHVEQPHGYLRAGDTSCSHSRGLGEGSQGRQLQGRGFSFGALMPALGSGPTMSDINSTYYRWDSVQAPAVVDWRLTPRITPIFPQFQVRSQG